ncbi:hypothetical protein NFI95_09090 [Acetobacteraceae bacterium KSS8]|uniref:Glycerophosphotransferase n=1 Tax=Endosaccharibacter trunci TaxID=2812733 RepID=A0ABT1W6V2_9PROT|nr:hypothetical protein [Acetobacteraceae bacterium KSS8]
MRIGFLFNHDATHQVPHTIPVAAALARRGVMVEILCSTPEQRAVAERLLPDPSAVRFTMLNVGALAKGLDRVLRHVMPFRRLAVLRENTASFVGLDALVVPEITSTRLRDRPELAGMKLIYVPHGAGDGAAGFLPATRRFDLVLLSGEKVRDRMLDAGLITEDRSEIIGYPKFDLLDAPVPRLFDNDKPTILYNPHFNPHLSSWYRFGPEVLRWFASQDRFNLVFAPHVMLFKRLLQISPIHKRAAWRPGIPREAFGRPNILLDTGSDRSIDMSYVRAADLYLGDVSSQIYEWIQKPRPAVFFDTHRPSTRQAADYAHWALGQVVRSPAELPAALDHAMAFPLEFDDVQRDAARHTFSIETASAGDRAADAILRFLKAYP